MTIHVKFFAILRDKTGLTETDLSLPDNATVATAVEHIATTYPVLRPMLRTIACAVNLSYAHSSTVLKDGDELALIPPVSGGAF